MYSMGWTRQRCCTITTGFKSTPGFLISSKGHQIKLLTIKVKLKRLILVYLGSCLLRHDKKEENGKK